MQRDMSYELDGIFATRGQGELTTVKQTRTRLGRAPGLQPMARMAGGDVRNLTPAIGAKLRGPTPRPIMRNPYHSLDAANARKLDPGFYRSAGDLAEDLDYDMPFEGMGAVTLPIVGTVSVGLLAVAAVGAYLLLKK